MYTVAETVADEVLATNSKQRIVISNY